MAGAPELAEADGELPKGLHEQSRGVRKGSDAAGGATGMMRLRPRNAALLQALLRSSQLVGRHSSRVHSS
jgi:hypothetical protein